TDPLAPILDRLPVHEERHLELVLAALELLGAGRLRRGPLGGLDDLPLGGGLVRVGADDRGQRDQRGLAAGVERSPELGPPAGPCPPRDLPTRLPACSPTD